MDVVRMTRIAVPWPRGSRAPGLPGSRRSIGQWGRGRVAPFGANPLDNAPFSVSHPYSSLTVNYFAHFIHFSSMLTSVQIQKPVVASQFASKRAPISRASRVVRAASIAAEDVPTPEKRGLMNLLLLGAIGARA